jgi:hypothetical protein
VSLLIQGFHEFPKISGSYKKFFLVHFCHSCLQTSDPLPGRQGSVYW